MQRFVLAVWLTSLNKTIRKVSLLSIKQQRSVSKLVNNKLVRTRKYYILLDFDGEVIRKSENYFPHSVVLKELEVILDLNELEEAPF